MEILNLYKESFDGTENNIRSALGEEVIFTCRGDGARSAHGVMSAFIFAMDSVGMYLGWDGEVYPKFRIESKEI